MFRFGECEFDPWIARRCKQSFLVAGIVFDELVGNLQQMLFAPGEGSPKGLQQFLLEAGITAQQILARGDHMLDQLEKVVQRYAKSRRRYTGT